MSEERLPNAVREANQNAENKTRAIIKVIRANMYFPPTHAPKKINRLDSLSHSNMRNFMW